MTVPVWATTGMRKIIKGRRRTVILTGKPATGVYKEDAKIESTAKSLAKKNPQNYKKCPRCGKTISSNAKNISLTACLGQTTSSVVSEPERAYPLGGK